MWTYDSRDRLQTGANSTGSYVYDDLGRQLTVPGIDTPAGAAAGNLSLSYFDDDLIESVSQDGTTTAYTLDVAGRRSVATVTGTNARTLTRHYADPTDNPAWVESTVGGTTSTSWYGSSLGGDLGVTVTDGVVSVALADLHGDVVTTVTLDGSGDVASFGEFSDYDEYGRLVTVQPDTGAATYGWLGAHERAVDDSGLILMGVRLYNPITGSFTSTDPVPGGGATAYAYPSDPVNQFDLDGRMWGWFKKAVKVVTKVAEIASYIPGPIGMVASGVAVAGNLAQGNYKAAAEAALGLIPGGKLLATAAKVAKAATKTVKASKTIKKVVAATKSVVKSKGCNSFLEDTPVEMADGTFKDVEDIVVGDQVLATDPVTGETTGKPVTDLIRHLDPHVWVAVTVEVDGVQSVIDATDEHPFYVEGAFVPAGLPAATMGTWVNARDLKPGDRLHTAAGGNATVVALAVTQSASDWAYNFTVDDFHTYYVGDDPVLVHNSACNIATHGVPKKPGVYHLQLSNGQTYIGRSYVSMHGRVHAHARRFASQGVTIVSAKTTRSAMSRTAIDQLERRSISMARQAGVNLANRVRYLNWRR